MKKLLVPVDGLNAARTRAALQEAIAISRREPVTVHLLSVQPAVNGHVAAYFGAAELLRIQEGAGHEELVDASACLDEARVPHTTGVAVGRRAETIARVAQRQRCDLVVMGRPDEAGLAGRMFGTVAEQVRQLLAPAGRCRVIGG